MVLLASPLSAASAISKSWRGVFTSVLFATSAITFAGYGYGQQFGDIEVLNATTMPSPEGVSVDRGRIYVSGPAAFGTAGAGPSEVFVYDRRSGSLEAQFSVEGEDLEFEHTLGANAVDALGRLYAVTSSVFAPDSARLGMVRFTERGGRFYQESYSQPFPNLPSCPYGPIETSCAVPNDFVFAPDGSAYVTDYFQAVIWRVPPGGGEPEVWLHSPLFAAGEDIPSGLNGIRLDPSRGYIYVAVTGASSILRIPLKESPIEEDIELFHQYPANSGPDGLVFGASGNLYVALGIVSEISVLAPNGGEVARISSSPDDPIPLDGPAGLAFDSDSGSLLVTNHENPENFALLKIFVNDRGDPLERPFINAGDCIR